MIKQSKKIIHRALSVLLIAVFLLSENAVAQPFPAVTPAVPDTSLHSPTEGFVVPPGLGSIQEYFKASENAPFVLLIQDAHAVIDAQHSIQSLIGYIQKHYGVKLIAVEGGAGKMDTTLLHTYPDDFIKRQVFERYLKRAEVSGIEMAAVLNSQRGTYYGIEDWELYELNYAAYLRVHETREDVQQILRQFRGEMDRWRRELYTPELNEFHERLQAFEEDRAHLLEFLKYLTRVNRVPSIGYEHLAPLMESAAKDESEEEIKNINASVRSMAESFRRGYFSRIPREVQMEFNQKNQAHKTGQMEDGAFLKYIVEVGKSVGLEPKLPLLLRDLVGQAETLSMIRGTRVFDELKQYLEETENKLLGSVEQRNLADKFKKLRLLENLVKLELIRDDWEKLNASPLPENWRTRLGDSLAPAMDYYRVALQRDAAFKRNLADQMRREKTRSAIVLAGGFHTVGFIDALKAEGYSYAVITPKIESLDGHEAYDDVMQGRLSYADNLETTLYDAFMRHASLQMVSDLDQSGYQRVLKVWRDEVIRALASEGRIREAGKYTRYIDRLTRVFHEKFEGAQRAPVTREQILAAIEEEMGRFQETTVKEVWEEFQMQIDQIGQSLRALAARGDLSAGSNRESIRQALRSPTATLNTPRVVFIPNLRLAYPNRRERGRRREEPLRPEAGAVRSEMRMKIPQEFSQVTETNRTEVGRGIQSFLKEAVAQRKNDDVLVAWYLSQALNSDGQKDNLYSDERLSEFFEAFQDAPRLKALILDGWIFSEFESVPAWHPLLAELFSTYSSFLSQAGEYYSSEDAGILYALAIRHIESSEFIQRMRTSDVRGEFKARYRRNYNVDNPIAMVRISGGYELFDKEKTPRAESFKVLEFANKENPDKLGAKLFRVRETTYSSQKPADALRTREPAEGLYAPDWTNDPSVWTARVRDSIVELIGKLRAEGIQSMAIGEGGIFKGTMVNDTDLDTNLFIVGEPDEPIRQRIEASFSSILEAKGVKLSEAPRLVFIAPDSETVSYEIRRDERGVFIVTPTGQTSFHYKMMKTESITVNLSNGSAAVQLPSRIQAGLKNILINFGSKAYQSGVRLALQELSLTQRLEPGVRIISRSPAVQTVSEDLDARKSADLLLNLFGKENLPKDSSDVDKIRNLENFLEGALREMDRLAAAVENTLMRRIEKDLTALAANLAQEGVENPKAEIANVLRQLAEPPTEDTAEWSKLLGRVQEIFVNYPLIVDRASEMLPAIAEEIVRSELRTGEGLAINMQPLADFPDALQAVSELMSSGHMAPSNIWIGDLKDARVPAVYDSDTRAMIINSRYLNPGSFEGDVSKQWGYDRTKDFEKLYRLGLQAAVYADFDEGSGYYSAGADPYYNREFWRPQLPRILYALGSKSEFFRKVAAAYFSRSVGGGSVSFLLRPLVWVWNMAASLISGITGRGMIREIRSGATVPKTEWPVFAGEYLKKLVSERGAFRGSRTNAGLLYGANFEPEIRASLETALQELVSEEQATGHPSVASSYKGNVWDLVIRSQATSETALGVAGEIISRAKLGPSNLLSVLRENRSLFFREEGYYKKLRAHLPELLSARRAAFAESRTPQEIVITIVGAGFNEEALSTAMVLEEMFKAEGINRAEVDYRVEVFSRPNLVFDRLVTASRDDKDYPLIYPDGAMKGVSEFQKDVYFEYDAAKKAYRPRKELTQRISYQEIDLLAVDLPAAARQRPADIIALHHVLTYLVPESVPLSTRRTEDLERNETLLQSLNVAGKVVKETIYAGILNEQELASATPIRVEGSISESEILVHDLSAQKAYLRKTNPEGSSAQEEVHLTRVADLDRDVRRYAYEEAVRGMMAFFYEKLGKNGRLSIISDTGTQTPIARYLELGFANHAGVPFLVKTLPDFPSLDQAVRSSGPDSVRSELRSEVPYLEVEPFWASEIPADKEAVENMLKRVREAAPQDLPQAFREIQRAFESGEVWDPLNRIDQQSDLGLARRNAAALFLLPAAFDYFMDAKRRRYLEGGISIFREENYETVMWNMLRLFFLQVPQKIFRNPTVSPVENAQNVSELLLSRIQRLAPQQESGTSAAVKKRKAAEMEALHTLWKAHVHSMQDLQWFIPAAFRDAWYGNHLAQQHGVFTNLFEHEVLIDAEIYPTLAKIGAEAFVWWRPEPESKDFTAVIRFRKRRNNIQSEIAISSATGRVVWSPQGYQSLRSKDLKELKWGPRALKEIRTFVTARIKKDSEVGEPDPRWTAILGHLESRSELRGLAEKDLISEEPTVRDLGRSELRMAAYERGEPIPEADLEGRYQATEDFIFMDGIYYVQNNDGLQDSLNKVRKEINKKESQDKIVVLADGINRWNLEFLHSFHTVSALYQLNNLSEVLRDQTLLDLGAGSGVLGITALLKGARNVIAVDMDEEVLEKAAESLRLTEEANGMSKGALQSRFSPVKMKYDEFAEMIQQEDFQFLKTRVSSSPVVINNNHDPFNADNVIAKIMGPWLDAQGKGGIPAPARFVLAGLAYEQRDDYDDEETEEDSLPPAFVNILRARYRSALRGWVLKEVQFSRRDVYVGFTFEAPGKRSELRRSDSRDTYYALGGSHFKVKVPSLLSEAYLIELIGILNDVGPSQFDEAFAQVMRDISESAESNRDQLQRALRRLTAGVLQEIQSLRTTEELITFIDSPEMERMIETQIQSLGEMPDTMKQKIAAQLLAELLRTALDGLRYGRAAAPAIKAFSALPAEDLQALQEMTNAYSREGVLSLRDLELGIRELASSENYSGVADLQLGSEALLIDAAFVPNPKDPAFLQVLRFLQAFSQERTLVLSYRPGTPQENIVQELRQKLGFAKALLAPVDSDSRIILSKIPSEIVSGMRFMVSIGTVIVAPNREAGQSIVISNNAMSADPVFGRHEEIGREQGFLMLAVMILGSPHLMQWLEDRGKNNPREMNADVFSRFVSFMADLAKTNAIRQAVAASA
ncbi:MAG: hypothetical protein FGM27_06550 [Candidatus Omnitrophica bacterium]|nr:hypothetical protein [Candidatus Omnitrophota bacterium]